MKIEQVTTNEPVKDKKNNVKVKRLQSYLNGLTKTKPRLYSYFDVSNFSFEIFCENDKICYITEINLFTFKKLMTLKSHSDYNISLMYVSLTSFKAQIKELEQKIMELEAPLYDKDKQK